MLMILKIFSRAGISYQTYLGHSTTQGKEYLSIIDILSTSIGDNDRNQIIDLSKRLSFQQSLWLSLASIVDDKWLLSRRITAVGLATSSLQGGQKLIVPQVTIIASDEYANTRPHAGTMQQRRDEHEKMHPM